MEAQDRPESKVQWVIQALLTGQALKAKDLAEIASEQSQKAISPQSAARILSRISDPEKSDLGRFIRKSKQGGSFVYQMVGEALMLTPAQAYGLTVKSGRDRYTLDQAVADFPGLRPYAGPGYSRSRQMIRVVKRMATEPGGLFRFRSGKNIFTEKKDVELTFRYSDRYALSLSSSLFTFFFICLAGVLSFTVCCFVAYAFFFPLFAMGLVIVCAVMGASIWRNKTRRLS